MEKVAGIDRDAALPKYHGRTFVDARRAAPRRRSTRRRRPSAARRCSTPPVSSTTTTRRSARRPGRCWRTTASRPRSSIPRCCGMPQLEQGDLAEVAERRAQVRAALVPWIDQGYDIVALVPSCALMLKFEWPLIAARRSGGRRSCRRRPSTSANTSSTSPARRAWRPACSRSTAASRCTSPATRGRRTWGRRRPRCCGCCPRPRSTVIERCSGHGGSWGVMKENFETALKVGKPVARQALQEPKPFVASECPLAGMHIAAGDGNAGEGRSAARPLAAPDRTVRPRLRDSVDWPDEQQEDSMNDACIAPSAS